MKLFKCCCGWSYVIGRKRVYGAIYPMGIGDFPSALSSTQRMMTRAEFADNYADCAACLDGHHKHAVSHGLRT